MASPTTLGGVGIGSTIAGGALSAFGAISAGQSQKQMYDYQSQVAKINANIDKQNSEWEQTKGEIEAQQYGLKAGQQFGQIRATQGASNIDVNSGSAAEVQRSQRQLTTMDISQIRANAAKNAYDYQVKGVMDTDQSKLYTAAGENAEKAGYIGAASSILGSVSSVSSKWIQGSTAGLWGNSKASNPYYAPLDYNG